MSIWEVIFIGLVLSVDSFSAAIALGFKPHTRREALTFAFSSGTAEALVAFLGALSGKAVTVHFSQYDHWIAFGILMMVALHMLYESFRDMRGYEDQADNQNFHSFFKVLIVSLATSLDAFGVGIGLGVTQVTLWPILLSIGLWAFVSTLLGLALAKKISRRFGPFMGLLGSFVLMGLAFKMLSI